MNKYFQNFFDNGKDNGNILYKDNGNQDHNKWGKNARFTSF